MIVLFPQAGPAGFNWFGMTVADTKFFCKFLNVEVAKNSLNNFLLLENILKLLRPKGYQNLLYVVDLQNGDHIQAVSQMISCLREGKSDQPRLSFPSNNTFFSKNNNFKVFTTSMKSSNLIIPVKI